MAIRTIRLNRINRDTKSKIDRAYALFLKCDNGMKSTVIHGTGLSGPINEQTLRDHFSTLDAMNNLDFLIFDMEEDIQYTESKTD